jgi:hypothetical protein
MFPSVHNHFQAVTFNFKPNICHIQLHYTNNITSVAAICHSPLTETITGDRKTWLILNRPTIKHVIFLQKYNDNQFFLQDTTFWGGEGGGEDVFVTLLSSKAGMSVWQIMWVTTLVNLVSPPVMTSRSDCRSLLSFPEGSWHTNWLDSAFAHDSTHFVWVTHWSHNWLSYWRFPDPAQSTIPPQFSI